LGEINIAINLPILICLYLANCIDCQMQYGGFGSIYLLGISFSVCALSSTGGLIAVNRMLLDVKRVIEEGSLAAINLSVIDWLVCGRGASVGFAVLPFH